MITEHVLLPVIAGQEDAFEKAFASAKEVIRAADGFESLTLSRSVERPNTYLLLIQWQTLEDHLTGFRESAAFMVWRALLYHFYDQDPLVEHFGVIQSV